MTKNVRQAVILVGGKASRLRADSIDVPISKAFMTVADKPILYWCLLSLHEAGIRTLVIVGDQLRVLRAAEKTIKHRPCRFTRIDYFHDEGNGAHGVLHELRYLLDEYYIFECGHSFSLKAHYKLMMHQKNDTNIVFSAFRPTPKNLRQPVALKQGKVTDQSSERKWAIAHPILGDKAYARSLLELGFNIENIIAYYVQNGLLAYVKNTMPPEYDIADEMRTAHAIYQHYLASLATI
ncbi:MAG TPA: NTP transferase domain-containing protein [Verrucomicrobiae bacterium]|nr:NTP transferase domain-containing protein [Verrucomicrobiae bacterium]